MSNTEPGNPQPASDPRQTPDVDSEILDAPVEEPLEDNPGTNPE